MCGCLCVYIIVNHCVYAPSKKFSTHLSIMFFFSEQHILVTSSDGKSPTDTALKEKSVTL